MKTVLIRVFGMICSLVLGMSGLLPAQGLTDLSYPVGAVMFYALYNALGSDDFDRAYRDFYQSFRDTGATSADLVAAFHRVSPTADRIFQDWFLTTRWYARLRGGESLEQIVETYRQP
jgi:hypothetical protein